MENSYKSPDSVNQIDWQRKAIYSDVFNYYKSLIKLRKNHPAFRMTGSVQIRGNLDFCTKFKLGVVGYCLNGDAVGDTWEKILVFFNGNRENVTMQIPEGEYFNYCKEWGNR